MICHRSKYIQCIYQGYCWTPLKCEWKKYSTRCKWISAIDLSYSLFKEAFCRLPVVFFLLLWPCRQTRFPLLRLPLGLRGYVPSRHTIMSLFSTAYAISVSIVVFSTLARSSYWTTIVLDLTESGWSVSAHSLYTSHSECAFVGINPRWRWWFSTEGIVMTPASTGYYNCMTRSLEFFFL